MPTPVKVDPRQILPMRAVDAFFADLPNYSVQFLAEVSEVRVTASNLVANTGITVLDFQVTDKYVWVVTDFQAFGLCPSRDLEAPMIAISAEQLAGLIRFDLTMSERQPLRVDVNLVDPYSAASAVASTKTGWPFTATSLTNRGSFALYAKSQQHVKVTAYVDVVPRFWLSVLGARITGFSLPETSFDEIFNRR